MRGGDAVARELQATQDLLDAITSEAHTFRPFGGGGHLGRHLFSRASVEWLAAQRATAVLWNSVPGDWLDADGWVDTALSQADQQEHTVVVLHDILPDAMQHLSRFLDGLEAAGHQFTNEYPDTCLPMVDGHPRPTLDAYVQ